MPQQRRQQQPRQPETEYRDYNQWSAEDMRRFNEWDIATRRADSSGMISRDESDLPDSYRQRYGADARAEFTRDLLRESARRGGNVTTINAETLAETVYGRAAGLTAQDGHLDSRREHAYDNGLGSNVRANLGQATNNAIARQIISPSQPTTVTIPANIANQFLDDNPRLLRNVDRKVGYDVPVSDELAYDVGYSERAQRDRFNNVYLNGINEQEARRALPQVTREIFNENHPDLPARDAFAAGYIQSEFDKRHNYENLDNLDGVTAPPRTPRATANDNQQQSPRPTFTIGGSGRRTTGGSN